MELTSTANPRVKALLGLRRRRGRDRSGTTIVEGREELEIALAAGQSPAALYYCPDLVDPSVAERLVDDVADRGAEIYRVSQKVFERIAYRQSPDGWLALLPGVVTDLSDLRVGANPLFLVCQAVEKPGNLGAMLRTADAAGVDAVIAADPVADWANPNVVRASKGTLFSVPVSEASTPDVLAWLREHSIAIVAATPSTETVYTAIDYSGPTAIVVGTEKHGLTPEWIGQADDAVRIPMNGQIDSLNVATSAALIIYEALRQRTTGFTRNNVR